MKHLLNKQGMGTGSTPNELFCDNQGYIKLVKNLVMQCHDNAYRDRNIIT